MHTTKRTESTDMTRNYDRYSEYQTRLIELSNYFERTIFMVLSKALYDTYISTFCRNNKAKHKTESYSIQTKKVPEKMEIILNKGY